MELNGAKEKHVKRNWIKKGNLTEQYERFLSSQDYRAFQGELCEKKPSTFHANRMPTISEKMFRSLCCKCIGDPTTASCVDMIFDKLLNFVEALNEYFLDPHYFSQLEDECEPKLARESRNCDCEDCENCKPKWIDIFKKNKSTISTIDLLMDIMLCPKTEEKDLTLQSDDRTYNMYGWNCGHGKCDQCGIWKLPWDCPILSNNDEEVTVLEWQDCARAGNNVQPEICETKMKVSELVQKFKVALEAYVPHCIEKDWLNRARKLGMKTMSENTIQIFTDFSAMMDLTPNKTDNCHVDNHAVLAVYFVLTNPRKLKLEKTGEIIDYITTDVWYAIGGTQDKGKKNDVTFHKAVLHYILEYYAYLLLTRLIIWTDNCSGQYKCRQNFFDLSKIPYSHPYIEEVEHCFAQVYGFKGPWDAAGKVVKAKIKSLESEQKCRAPDAFSVYKLMCSYFKEKLPNDRDWKQLASEGSELLKRKTEFTAVNRKACFVTDYINEYEDLKEKGHEDIIFTNRSEVEHSEDTTVYEGTSKVHHVYTGIVKDRDRIPEKGYKLSLKTNPCFCAKCRNNQVSECQYKTITGEVNTFCKVSKEDLNNKKKAAAEAHLNNMFQEVQRIAQQYNADTLQTAPVNVLNMILSFMKIKATREMTEIEKESGKTLPPKKADKLRAISWLTFLNKVETYQTQE